jgi:hypothetical protein
MHNHNDNEQLLSLPAGASERPDDLHDFCGERPECASCERVWEFDYENLHMEHEGVYLGSTVPLIPTEELAETLGVHPNALPFQLMLHHLPVYSVGDKIYLDPLTVRHMLQVNNLCIADL